jgi:hypothetical protein
VIHDAGHNTVTVVDAGSLVHDFVSVTTSDPSTFQPTPSGNATVDFFAGDQCQGSPLATSSPLPLLSNGQVDVTSFVQGPLLAGFYAFEAHYQGDTTYMPSSGSCEVLQVVDASVQLTPTTSSTPAGTTQTLTCHVSVNEGFGDEPGSIGSPCFVELISGPGTVSTQSCVPAGVTGSCEVSFSSASTGTSVFRATVDPSVGGLTLHRETGDTHPGDGPNAQVAWVAARIRITPTATNEVGAPHTFSVVLEEDAGGGAGFVPAAGQHVDVALSDADGADHTTPTGTCTNPGANTDASGQCTITFTSESTGTVTGHASATLSVGGSAPFTVQTDGTALSSSDAVKTFVDANIQISPSIATNEVHAQHELTAHVNVDGGGGGGFQPAPDGTTVSFTIGSGPGQLSSATCQTSGGTGSCSVELTSSSAGTTVVGASTDVVVGGVALARSTDGNAGNSGSASETWVDANVSIAPNGTSPIGVSYPLTAHVSVDDGSGAGFVNTFPGTVITFTIDNGPGSLSSNTCTVSAGGSCQVTLSSAVAGTTTVSAHTAVFVGGVVLFRDTDGFEGDSGPVTVTWS